MIDFEGDAEETQHIATQKELSAVSDLTAELHTIQARIARGREILAELEKAETKILCDLLPASMKEANLKAFEMPNGMGISVTDHVVTSIKKADKPVAYAWLGKNGYGSLVKTKYTIDFGMGELERAGELQKFLDKEGFDYGSKQDVHAGTLKKFGKDALAAGLVMPEQIKITTFPKAEIKK
ncbi:MAG: hypothetical protein COA47_09995 [Robiginitomaculum sp.]|nr:MAG: hypothetical protein COA47_09995 [Robiginitomaculum sp.]